MTELIIVFCVTIAAGFLFFYVSKKDGENQDRFSPDIQNIASQHTSIIHLNTADSKLVDLQARHNKLVEDCKNHRLARVGICVAFAVISVATLALSISLDFTAVWTLLPLAVFCVFVTVDKFLRKTENAAMRKTYRNIQTQMKHNRVQSSKIPTVSSAKRTQTSSNKFSQNDVTVKSDKKSVTAKAEKTSANNPLLAAAAKSTAANKIATQKKSMPEIPSISEVKANLDLFDENNFAKNETKIEQNDIDNMETSVVDSNLVQEDLKKLRDAKERKNKMETLSLQESISAHPATIAQKQSATNPQAAAQSATNPAAQVTAQATSQVTANSATSSQPRIGSLNYGSTYDDDLLLDLSQGPADVWGIFDADNDKTQTDSLSTTNDTDILEILQRRKAGIR